MINSIHIRYSPTYPSVETDDIDLFIIPAHKYYLTCMYNEHMFIKFYRSLNSVKLNMHEIKIILPLFIRYHHICYMSAIISVSAYLYQLTKFNVVYSQCIEFEYIGIVCYLSSGKILCFIIFNLMFIFKVNII